MDRVQHGDHAARRVIIHVHVHVFELAHCTKTVGFFFQWFVDFVHKCKLSFVAAVAEQHWATVVSLKDKKESLLNLDLNTKFFLKRTKNVQLRWQIRLKTRYSSRKADSVFWVRQCSCFVLRLLLRWYCRVIPRPIYCHRAKNWCHVPSRLEIKNNKLIFLKFWKNKNQFSKPTSAGSPFSNQTAANRFSAPSRRKIASWFLINFFDEGRKYFRLVVCRTASQQQIVRMPVDCGHRRFDWFFDVFANPPIVCFFKIANVDNFGTTTDSEFVLFRWPSYTCGRSIDS